MNHPLQYGKYYHIYNRGIDRCNLFNEPGNYQHFLNLYDKYISLVADTYCWCLMKNHFHLLIRIKDENEIEALLPPDCKKRDEEWQWRTQKIITSNTNVLSKPGENELKKPIPFRMFAHLFNAYTKYYNKCYDRTGSLFEKNFRRIPVESEDYFRKLIIYIHFNPVRHGFTKNVWDYPWSSYGSIISLKATKLKREAVLGWFNQKADFVYLHQTVNKFDDIAHLMIDE